ncbi:hypothetical protein GOP47_0023042 [Adiantum capillus-veneris]|uniref:F-box domain-containing protein n=1 Tax=Adiantum capillus-veneris TaxID=13818 RepID=A0A9D4U6Q9_ADICA|nr:hypothetical protein GOP47_0023042 [Adiantum capillus-veneris]
MVEGDGVSPARQRLQGAADEAWYGTALSNVNSSPGRGTPLASSFLDLPPALITEIFKHLNARELSLVSCVCSLFRGLSSDSHGWKDFYCERWGNPVPGVSMDADPVFSERTWRDLYVARETRSKAFLGRYQTDMMNGHSNAVRCVRLLAPANLIFTAGYDSILRIWDLEECLPLSWSWPLGTTLRSIAVDMKMLVVGGTDANIRIWKGLPDLKHIFDVGGACASEIVLSGHEGPITSLSMDDFKICSGSWDMTVKLWDRGSLACIRTLIHRDWVWAISLRGQRMVSSAGSDVYSWDVETGRCLRVRAGAHHGQAYAVECSRSGHFVFSGGEDGIIRMYEDKVVRKKGLEGRVEFLEELNNEPIAFWQPHSGAVHELAFEDPWLVSASGDGALAMMDIRKVRKRNSEFGRLAEYVKVKSPWTVVSTDAESPQRMLFGSKQCFYSVDVGSDRIVSAGEEQVVKVWDFSHALEIERRVQASRMIRLERRFKRKQGLQLKTKQHNEVCNSMSKKDVDSEGAVVWQGRGIKIKG